MTKLYKEIGKKIEEKPMDKSEVLMYHEKVLEAQRIAEYDYKRI